MRLDEVHWIRPDLHLEEDHSTRNFDVRFRYRQPLQKAELKSKGNYLIVTFDQAQSGIAAGQFATWYDGDECIGSGVICD